MKILYVSKGISKSEALENHIEKGLERAKEYFGDSAECKVVYRKDGKLKVCEITILRKGEVIRCEKKHEDMFTAANDAIDTLWGKIRKYKSKADKIRRGKHDSKIELHGEQMYEEDTFEQDIEIARHKTISPDVMTIPQAALALNLVGHDFYTFVAKETGRVSVIYKRDNTDSYGIIDVK